MSATDFTHALSFDIEDWFHLIDIAAVADPARWASLPSLVETRTLQILELLDEFHTRATFFILGWVADRYPDLVRRIADRGHEIGTHSYWHRKVYDLAPETFAEDVQRSIAALERHPGVKVYGFRAPVFSIRPGAEWAFDVLARAGLEYDASLFPVRRGSGGYPGPQSAHRVRGPAGAELPELPMSIAAAGPVRLCFSGGGYFRLLPLTAIEWGFRQMAQAGRPTVVYLHPRDFAPDCPRVPMPLLRRFKIYVGLHTTAGKLRHLLTRYRFATCREVLGEQLGGTAGG